MKHCEALHKVYAIVEDSGWELEAESNDSDDIQQLSDLSDEIMRSPKGLQNLY